MNNKTKENMKAILFKFTLSLIILSMSISSLYAQSTIERPHKNNTSSTTNTPIQRKTNTPTSSSAPTNPQRTVIYKFARNEVLDFGENFLSFKGSGTHSACIIRDTIANKTSIVMDGTKKITADAINNMYIDGSWYWNDFYIDADDYSKCIFPYRNGNNEYIYIEGKTYGPYRNHIYYRGASPQSGDDRNPFFVNKGIYSLGHKDDQTGKCIEDYYLYGEPIKREYNSYDWHSPNTSLDPLSSPNQRYKVTSSDFYSVVINGSKVNVLPSYREGDYTGRQVAILNDGRCVVEYWNSDTHKECIFIVSEGTVNELAKNEWFNYRTLRIDKRDLSEDKDVLVGYYLNQDRYSITAPNSHVIVSSIKGNYVLVDNKKYGKGCAMSMWYYKNINSFVWTAKEGNELVMYKYKL